jgi:hypothetical protein
MKDELCFQRPTELVRRSAASIHVPIAVPSRKSKGVPATKKLLAGGDQPRCPLEAIDPHGLAQRGPSHAD